MLPLDISALPGDVQREFLECRHTREVLALAAAPGEQEATGAENRALGDRKSINGLGAPVLEIAPTAFFHWGLRLGFECWRDKGFVREFARDNPAARVKAGGTKTQVGYGGNADCGMRIADCGLGEPKGNGARAERGQRKEGGESGAGKFRKSYGARVGEAALAR